MKHVNIDPEKIMSELEQYDIQDARGASVDPELYDNMLQEFSRFVRNDNDEEREGEGVHDYFLAHKVPFQLSKQAQKTKVAINLNSAHLLEKEANFSTLGDHPKRCYAKRTGKKKPSQCFILTSLNQNVV
ncbi:unnamed protein product [Strongylus vulgaris]|uniref:Uncharacterized protein n=1 Tax=Strongylus vulgaris TaxID=40348 RepID=A0A3P7JJH2_STRVU|nr:unnamed protein product [Strongylus vulgaris]